MIKDSRSRQILLTSVIMALIAFVLLVVIYRRGKGEHITVLKSTGLTVLQSLPILLFSFIAAEGAQLVIPEEATSRWVGGKSNLRGILLGTLFGSLTPPCPVLGVLLAATLLRAGASIGTAVAFMTSALLLPLTRLPIEVSLIGWEFALIRLACTVLVPVFAGLIANLFFSGTDLRL